jgi:DNA-binding response OmpR family regulator
MLVATFPPRISPILTAGLIDAGATPVAVTDAVDLTEQQPAEGWVTLVVELAGEPQRSLALARRAREVVGVPVLVVVGREQMGLLENEDGYDDFLLSPIDPRELKVRLRRLDGRVDEDEGENVIRFKDLELNLATYQATVDRRPVDLTYMEYELLRFFVTNDGRAWTREQILSRVWGYDYFGGARTVDVHVRRLRAKLGEERASWITTIRSVGYRFG